MGSGAVMRSTPRRDGPSGSRAEPWSAKPNLTFILESESLSLFIQPKACYGPRAYEGAPRMTSCRPVLLLALVATLPAACGRAPKPQPEDPAKVAARAASMLPADPRLAGLYRASCQNCHGHPESGAPPAGYHFAWDPRWAQGQPTL